MTPDLFDNLPPALAREDIAPGAVILRGFARDMDDVLIKTVGVITAQSPPHHMQTPGGATMSVATTSCGTWGWESGPEGYRYAAHDSRTGQPWPAMPDCLSDLAGRAAAHAGYAGFVPDSCLINQYAPGAKLSLHQDKDEKDLRAPIVSLSLGLPAVFVFGTTRRAGPVQRYRLVHGDVVVWGGPARLAFHGVLPLADGAHALLGSKRLNLTLRRAHPA